MCKYCDHVFDRALDLGEFISQSNLNTELDKTIMCTNLYLEHSINDNKIGCLYLDITSKGGDLFLRSSTPIKYCPMCGKRMSPTDEQPISSYANKFIKTVELFNGLSVYFTKSNPNWNSESDYNMLFLRTVERHANDMLKAYGYLTLNRVYELLGFDGTKAGMVVGWIYDKKNPTGDNFVEFDIREDTSTDESNPRYLIDFNVDGVIYDMISE